MPDVDIRRLARERLGFPSLRPGQEEAARAAIDGHDVLAVMPTGSGKSAIYQIAALALPGATVVVSPLLALQRDQVESIARQGSAPAAELNSTLGARERAETLERLVADELEFLFLAPEQLANEETLAELRAARPSLLVVDEAHCVSEWGHDFRPDYLRLGAVVEELDHPPVLALTATASPPVREEIVMRLAMREPRVVVRGFDRPNIRLEVAPGQDERRKRDALVERVAASPKPGIVYTATRRAAEEIAGLLSEAGVRAEPYHAGLSSSAREAAQTAFMGDRLDAIVATIAFGMGVDKPNVRFVLHAEPSDSLDAYYQEIGRAGRDGEPAEAVLFYRHEDIGLVRFRAGVANIDREQVERVAEAVSEAEEPVPPAELRDETELTESRLLAALGRLEDAGAVRVLPGGDVEPAEGDLEPAKAARLAVEAQRRHREFERSRVEMVRAYAETHGCRRELLLTYFGEPFQAPCGRCDNCEAGLPETQGSRGEEPFPVGARVAHDEWGEGTVQRYEAGAMTVLFDQGGYRTLDVAVVVEKGLLEQVE